MCDNGGFAVIERLQVARAARRSTTCWDTSRVVEPVPVDFAAARRLHGLPGRARRTPSPSSSTPFERARSADRTTVIAIRTDPHAWSEGGAFWEVGVPEVSERPEVRAARQAKQAGTATQRVGW